MPDRGCVKRSGPEKNQKQDKFNFELAVHKWGCVKSQSSTYLAADNPGHNFFGDFRVLWGAVWVQGAPQRLFFVILKKKRVFMPFLRHFSLFLRPAGHSTPPKPQILCNRPFGGCARWTAGRTPHRLYGCP